MSSRVYRYLSPEEVAALSPADQVAYRREREAFDAEVEEHKRHIAQHGWLNVGVRGRFDVPVVLKPRSSRA